MLRAYRYRIYPDGAQRQKMAQAFGCARFLYNQCLAWWKSEWERARSVDEPMNNLPLVTYFKKDNPFLNEVDSLVLMNARRHFEAALKNYFDSKQGKRKGRYVGFPKFKSKHKGKKSFQTNCVSDNIRILVEENCVRLPKIGKVEARIHRVPMEGGRIVSATVTQGCDGRYSVSIIIDHPDLMPDRKINPDELKVVGLDMSLTRFAVSSDGEDDDTRAKYIRQYRRNEKKIARLNRRMHRRVKGSSNRDKARVRLARQHAYVANCRKDFVCKQALHFARKYDVVVLEDINLRAMARSLNLGKSVMDLGFGEFRTRLQWKCNEYGSYLVKADKWFPSSKTCSCCGHVNKGLQLSDREWTCPECGSRHDRDYNAACNLRDYFLKILNTAGTAGIHACGEMSTTLRETLEQVISAKQEAPPSTEG